MMKASTCITVDLEMEVRSCSYSRQSLYFSKKNEGNLVTLFCSLLISLLLLYFCFTDASGRKPEEPH